MPHSDQGMESWGFARGSGRGIGGGVGVAGAFGPGGGSALSAGDTCLF